MRLIIYAGHELFARLEHEKARECTPSKLYPGRFESGSLCRWQSQIHARGIIHARLCQTIFGWSVRSGSGLDGFEVLAGHRDGSLPNATREQAIAWACEWVAADPANRYATD